MISYCVACYRPAYSKLLVEELIARTSAPYEIVLWLNTGDASLKNFLAERCAAGAPIRVAGETPENVGMAAYAELFAASRYDLVAQIDDDVLCVAPGLAETALKTFARFPSIGMLASDVWQDEYTTGARPPLAHYRLINREFGLYDGPIDGWFAVYRKSSLKTFAAPSGRYFGLGAMIRKHLRLIGQHAFLCTRMKVFHATGPVYASCFGMLESEIAKYESVGRVDMVDWYRKESGALPPVQLLQEKLGGIRQSLSTSP